MIEREKIEREIHLLTQIVDPDHRGRCFRPGIQIHAQRGPGRAAKADRDTQRPLGRPVETAERRLKLEHRGTQRPPCASQSISTKRS
jgi:hypothetical protein